MRLASSFYVVTFVTVAVTFSPSKARDLNEPVDFFTSDELLLPADTSESTDGTLEEFSNDLGFLDSTSPLLDDESASLRPDDIAISDNIDSSCSSPARKREFLDNDLLIGRGAKQGAIISLADSPL